MKAFCISHIKDVDGLSAAALVRAATGAELLLTSYEGILDDLDKVPGDAKKVVICDIGTNANSSSQFVDKLARIASRSKLTYIDHHYAPEATKRKIRRMGVKLVHDVGECASILTYLTFRETLPTAAKMVALYGAVTDYMDDSPVAKRLMEQTDRHFVLLEATMLAHAVARKGEKPGFPEMLAKELSKMKAPHEIDRVPELADEQLEVMVRLSAEVARRGKRLGGLAYVETDQQSTGSVANLLIGAFGVPVGVSMKKQNGWYEVSLRGTSECGVHLGRTIGVIAGKLGGTGGGHRRAAGCRIPSRQKGEMLSLLSRSL